MENQGNFSAVIKTEPTLGEAYPRNLAVQEVMVRKGAAAMHVLIVEQEMGPLPEHGARMVVVRDPKFFGARHMPGPAFDHLVAIGAARVITTEEETRALLAEYGLAD